MALELLLASLLPVIAYVLVEWKLGSRAGIATAIILTLALMVYLHLRIDGLDQMIFYEFGLLLLLGGISFGANNPTFFKFQPALTGLIIGSYVLFMQTMGSGLFARYVPIYEAAMPEMTTILQKPGMMNAMEMALLHLGVTMVVYAVIVAWAALRWSSRNWLLIRLSIYPASLIVIVMSLRAQV